MAIFVQPDATVPMHSTLIVKDIHDKCISTVLLDCQDSIFDTNEYVEKTLETAVSKSIYRLG